MAKSEKKRSFHSCRLMCMKWYLMVTTINVIPDKEFLRLCEIQSSNTIIRADSRGVYLFKLALQLEAYLRDGLILR